MNGLIYLIFEIQIWEWINFLWWLTTHSTVVRDCPLFIVGAMFQRAIVGDDQLCDGGVGIAHSTMLGVPQCVMAEMAHYAQLRKWLPVR